MLGADLVNLGSANDTLRAEQYVGKILAGSGNDDLTIQGARTVNLGGGDDSLSAFQFVTEIFAGTGGDDIGLNDAGDVYLGAGNDSLVAEGAVRKVGGGGGDDEIEVFQVQYVFAGTDNDVVIVKDFANFISAGDGNDTIIVNKANRVDSGKGDDVITATGFVDAIAAGAGNDDLNLSGGANSVSLGGGQSLPTETNFLNLEDGSYGVIRGSLAKENVIVAADAVVNGNIELHGGDDVVTVNGIVRGVISTGDGFDEVFMNAGGEVKTGANNDSVHIGEGGVTASLGGAADSVFWEDDDSQFDFIDGGGDFDTLFIEVSSEARKAEVMEILNAEGGPGPLPQNEAFFIEELNIEIVNIDAIVVNVVNDSLA